MTKIVNKTLVTNASGLIFTGHMSESEKIAYYPSLWPDKEVILLGV